VTTFLLVRHAAHEWLGRGFAGRLPGVGLNAQGRAEAQALVQRLAGVPLAAIYCSPQQRTQETAQPLADAQALPIQVEPGFDEVGLGDWTGRTFEDVRSTQAGTWKHWLERRSSAQPPGGERFADVPQRAMAALRRIASEHPEDHVLVVSHGDVLKAVVASVLGLSLDHLERFDILPASVTVVALRQDWMRLELLNSLGPLRP
jgi:probable phosphoglycerate mutase